MKRYYKTFLPDSMVPLLLTAEHAGNIIPDIFEFEIAPSLLETHHAYDIGVEDVVCGLSKAFGCSAVMNYCSRLVIDNNRVENELSLIVTEASGIRIKENQNVTQVQKNERLQNIYYPYHLSISQKLDSLQSQSRGTMFISIHSFTADTSEIDEPRPWDFGILWDGEDDDLACRLRKQLLQNDPSLRVALNKPYDLKKAPKGVLSIHALPRNIPCVEIEINQNYFLDDTRKGALTVTDILYRAIQPLLSNNLQATEDKYRFG